MLEQGYPFRAFGLHNVWGYFFEYEGIEYYIREVTGESLALIRNCPLPTTQIDYIQLRSNRTQH
jgi:hypothetical protein